MRLNKILPFTPAPYKRAVGLADIITSYKIHITGVVHVGAHYGQEVKEYRSVSIPKIVLIEPLAKPFKRLEEKFGSDKDIILFNTAIGRKTGIVELFVDNKNSGQSSSILKPKEHLKIYPKIIFDQKETCGIRPLSSFNFDSSYNLLNVDVQGYELEVLKSCDSLENFNVIILEVNEVEMYEGCCTIHMLDKFLKSYTRVKTLMTKNAGWGEATYIKTSIAARRT